MALKLSTGLRNGMLVTGSFKSLIDGGLIKIYSGTPPATADDAIGSATLLTTISVGGTGTGITFDSAGTVANGTLQKNASETWQGTNAASGTASFFRHVASGDDGTASTTQVRMQGTVDVAGADLNLTNPSLVSGAVQTVDYYSFNLPTL